MSSFSYARLLVNFMPLVSIAYHVVRFDCSDKITRLLIVCVSRKRNIIHRATQRQFLTIQCLNLLWLTQDFLQNKALHKGKSD